jgi:hypothetical protein
VGTLALAASYWLIRKVNRDNRSWIKGKG